MKKYARSILDISDYDTPTVTLLKKLDWLPIDVRIKYFEGIQVYNIIHGYCPRYLKDSIIFINHGVNTRRNANNNVLQISITKLKNF